ncbi:DUF6266 family protein [Pedobacter heparinus]|uniref:Uncharacterized protein n=1 Tax=Pedobacter heparinus (strain ATCC 13125 / DSM 2366 / CIP 104194 / JCM 7457 / NBRC 12017 / NCIMB 9290 / NRRL B-14731 / HIM 762-3) TaxID=485917 RepID=C6XWS6_PEDHD|nr:DUF6266 family protein [Pedobacter heparinus]ACU04220.1 hypothetical protein Phep_2015 [Pedobacter heparinus DSM 2366]
MGRYKNGITGPVRGKIGNVVGSTWRGIAVLKSLAEPSTKAPSEKQLNQRFVFAMVNAWLKPLRDLIWIGFQIFTGTKTPMNGAVSLLLKEAVTGNSRENYAIDFAKVILSRGELLISLIKQVLVLIDSVLQIKWENPSASVFCQANDKATVVVYNNAKQKFVIFKDVAKRADEQVDLQLPADFAGDAIHAWMHYVSMEGDAVSTSVYIGEYVI